MTFAICDDTLIALCQAAKRAFINPARMLGAMQTKSHTIASLEKSFRVCCLTCACAFTSLLPAMLCGQGTGFTYQGQLKDGANGASGLYDFAFSVWSQPAGPVQIGNTITNVGNYVSNGLFKAELNFGAGVFDGSQRWLEIAIRSNIIGGFTTLTPRQLISATPYAVHAGNVNAGGIIGTIPATSIASGTITSNMLAPGAAAANLAVSGQSALPLGSVVISSETNANNLIAAGYVKLEYQINAGSIWKERATNSSPAGHIHQTAIWTGQEMIIWGGYNIDCLHCVNTGARYNPTSNTWTPMATNSAPAGRYNHSSIWTGTELIIWGGWDCTSTFGDGARYNPATDTWTPISTNNAPSARYLHTAVWSGSEMIIWAGYAGGPVNTGYSYNPASNSWSTINIGGAPSARYWHTAVWTGSEMVVWGGYAAMNDGGRYSPATDTWNPVTMVGAPEGRSMHTAVWTGSEMIIWGGSTGSGNLDNGARFTPSLNKWTPMSSALTARNNHTALWTGTQMIVWGGSDSDAYNPQTDRWPGLAGGGSSAALGSVIWTGTELIAWGAVGRSSDTWLLTPPQILYFFLKP